MNLFIGEHQHPQEALAAVNKAHGDLPGRFLQSAANQGDGPVAAALGGFTHEYRVQIAETLARGTAEGLGTPNSHYETPRRTGCYYR